MKWGKVFRIARREYWIRFRRPFSLFFTFVMPILWWLGTLILIHWAAKSANPDDTLLERLSKPIAVVDQAQIFREKWKAPEIFVLSSDLDQGKAGVLEGRYIALVVIPPDYLKNRQVFLYLSSDSLPYESIIEQLIHLLSIYAELHDRYTFIDMLRLFTGPKIKEIHILRPSEAKGAGSSEVQAASFLWRALVSSVLCVVIAIIFTAQIAYLLEITTQEKESRILEVLLTSLSPAELLWGKVLGLGALGLTRAVVWLLLSWLTLAGLNLKRILQYTLEVFYQIMPQMIVAGLVILPLCYLSYALLFAGLGAVGAEHSNAREISFYIFFILMVVPLLFMMSFLVNPNGTGPRALSYFPLTMPTALILRLALGPLPWLELGGIAAWALLFTFMSYQASVRMFRLGLLPYSRRPAWREIWQILRDPV